MAFILLLQEATAYFSLVYLISGICGTAISKKLEKTIGQKVCVPTVEKNCHWQEKYGNKMWSYNLLLLKSSVSLHQFLETSYCFNQEPVSEWK